VLMGTPTTPGGLSAFLTPSNPGNDFSGLLSQWASQVARSAAPCGPIATKRCDAAHGLRDGCPLLVQLLARDCNYQPCWCAACEARPHHERLTSEMLIVHREFGSEVERGPSD
jgi:hypothetical protein